MEAGHATAELLLAEAGFGRLLQRDYWAVIKDCDTSPAEIVRHVARHFPAFAPEELVRFRRVDGTEAPLQVGDELEVRIAGAGSCFVQVIHQDAQSFTLATEAGHPEAGRITFGAYRNRYGDVLFHIRSHARSSTRHHRAGFLAAGEVMQTSTWTDFVNRVAVAFGRGVRGAIVAETHRHADEPQDVARTTPTYVAAGG